MPGHGVRTLFAIAIAGGMLTVPANAGAQAVQDASCPPLGGANTVVNGNNRLAQTFTAGLTGKLTSAQIRLTKNVADLPGNYTLSLASVDGTGTPTNNTLATTTIPEAMVPGGSINLPTTGVFPTPPDVTAAQIYALVISRPGAGATGVRLETRPGAGCFGSLFNSTSQVAPYADLGADMVFTTFVDRPPTIALGRHPKKKARKRKASFVFTSDEVGATFECKLDAGAFTPCTSPKAYKKLKPRRHTFEVRALDAVQNASAIAATFSWKVLKP